MSATKLHDLIALAREPSSERRRELLRGVTDLFFANGDGASPTEMSLFDDVLVQLTGDMEQAVRAELAEQVAAAGTAPPQAGHWASPTTSSPSPVRC